MRGKAKSPTSNKRERARNAVYLRHTQKPFNLADYTDKSAPSKRSAPNKRCKKGTRKHPKTKVCTDFKNGKFVGTPGKFNLAPNRQPFNWADYTDSNPWSEAPSKRSAPKKRCKNGTRKHPKTKVCTDFKNGKFVTTPKMSATYDSNGSNQSVKRDRYIPRNEKIEILSSSNDKQKMEGSTPVHSNNGAVSVGHKVKLNNKSIQELMDRHLAGDTVPPFADWDVSGVTDMAGLFSGFDEKEFDGDLSSWDVSNVENMNYMFSGCENVHFKGISDWDVSNVKDMNNMFLDCHNFNQNLSNWNVSNVRNMSHMFQTCTQFNQDLSSWDVSKVEDMNYMFSECENFKNKLPNFAAAPAITPLAKKGKKPATEHKGMFKDAGITFEEAIGK